MWTGAGGFLGASTQVESKQQRASWCLAPCVCWLAVFQRAAADSVVCDVCACSCHPVARCSSGRAASGPAATSHATGTPHTTGARLSAHSVACVLSRSSCAAAFSSLPPLIHRHKPATQPNTVRLLGSPAWRLCNHIASCCCGCCPVALCCAVPCCAMMQGPQGLLCHV